MAGQIFRQTVKVEAGLGFGATPPSSHPVATFADGAGAPVSGAGTMGLRYSHADARAEVSINGAAWAPIAGTVAIPANRIPYGNAGGTALDSEADLTYDAAANILTIGGAAAGTLAVDGPTLAQIKLKTTGGDRFHFYTSPTAQTIEAQGTLTTYATSYVMNVGANAAITIPANRSLVPGNGALATSDTGPFVYLPGMPGVPAAAPVTHTGRYAITVDSTGHRVFYNSDNTSTWRQLANASITVSAGAGLSGGGDLTAARTISMPNVGPGAGTIGGSGIASVTLDAQGRVTAAVAATYLTAVSLTDTHVGYGSGSNTLTGTATFAFSSSAERLSIGVNAATASLGRLQIRGSGDSNSFVLVEDATPTAQATFGVSGGTEAFFGARSNHAVNVRVNNATIATFNTGSFTIGAGSVPSTTTLIANASSVANLKLQNAGGDKLQFYTTASQQTLEAQNGLDIYTTLLRAIVSGTEAFRVTTGREFLIGNLTAVGVGFSRLYVRGTNTSDNLIGIEGSDSAVKAVFGMTNGFGAIGTASNHVLGLYVNNTQYGELGANYLRLITASAAQNLLQLRGPVGTVLQGTRLQWQTTSAVEVGYIAGRHSSSEGVPVDPALVHKAQSHLWYDNLDRFWGGLIGSANYGNAGDFGWTFYDPTISTTTPIVSLYGNGVGKRASFFGVFTPAANGGDGVICIHQVTAAPSANPTNAVLLYVDSSGNLLARTKNGNVRTVAAV